MAEDNPEIEIASPEIKAEPPIAETETPTVPISVVEQLADTTRQDAEQLAILQQELEVGRKTRKAPKFATNYNQADQQGRKGEMFGESAGTSASFIKDK